MGLIVFGLPLAVTLVTTPIIVRGLGPEQYGLYALFTALVGFAVLPASAKAVIRYSGSGPEGVMAALPGLFRTFVMMTLAAIAINIAIFILADRMLGVLPNHVTAPQWLLLVAVFVVALVSATAVQLLTGIMQKAGWWTTAATLLVTIGVTYQFVTAAAVLVSGHWLGVLCAGVVVSAAGTLFLSFLALRKFGRLPRGELKITHTGAIAFILSASIPIAIGNGMTIAERLIVSHSVGIEAVGYYSIAMALAGLIHAVASHGNATLSVAIKDADHSGHAGEVKETYERALRWTSGIVVLGALSLSLLGPKFVTLWLGSEVGQHVAPLLPWLAGAMGVLGLLVVPWTLTEMLGSPLLNIGFIGLAALILLLSAPILIDRHGVDGMAIGRLLSMAPAAAYLAIVELRSFKRIDGRFWALCIVRLVLAAALASFVMTLFASESLLSLLAAGTAGALAFAGLLLLTGHIKLREGL